VGQFGDKVEIALNPFGVDIERDVVADAHHVPAGHVGRFEHGPNHLLDFAGVVAREDTVVGGNTCDLATKWPGRCQQKDTVLHRWRHGLPG